MHAFPVLNIVNLLDYFFMSRVNLIGLSNKCTADHWNNNNTGNVILGCTADM